MGYRLSAASNIATMLAGGTSARMLCTCWKTKPPPGCQTCDLPAHVLADLRRGAVDQHVARIAAAAPEGEPAAEVALQARGVHAAAGDLHGVDGIQPGVDQAGQQFAHAAAAVQHDLQVRRALLDRCHMARSRGWKNSRYIAGETCGPDCMPRSSPKRITSMESPTALRKRVEVAQVHLHQLVEEAVGALGLAGQQHEEVVVAVKELAELQQVAAEEADDRAVGLLPQPRAPSRSNCAPSGPAAMGPGGEAMAVHMLSGNRRLEVVEVVLFHERPVGLLEIQTPSGMRAMTRPLTCERSTQSPWSRSGNAQAGIRQGVPSGSVHSAQCLSSSAKARPSSMVSTWNRCSTSSSTMASCWTGS